MLIYSDFNSRKNNGKRKTKHIVRGKANSKRKIKYVERNETDSKKENEGYKEQCFQVLSLASLALIKSYISTIRKPISYNSNSNHLLKN